MESLNRQCMQWEIASEYGQEKIVMHDAGQILSQRSIHPGRVEEMLTAVSEACLNALEHGNKLRRECVVTVQMSLSDQSCTFRIYDEGTGFDEERLQAGRTAGPEDDNSRGWGFLMITSFADQIRLGKEDGKFFMELLFLLEPAKEGLDDGNGTIASG